MGRQFAERERDRGCVETNQNKPGLATSDNESWKEIKEIVFLRKVERERKSSG